MSKKPIFVGDLDMLRSKYDFDALYPKTLSFKANDYFILNQTNTKHRNWWEVMTQRGEIGFIPSNYIERVTVSPAFYLQYLDHAIDYVQRHEIKSEYLVSEKTDLILRLKEMRRQVEQMPEVVENSISGEDGPPLLFKTSSGEIECIKSKKSFPSNNTVNIPKTYTRNSSITEEPIKQKYLEKKGAYSLNSSRECLRRSLEDEPQVQEIYIAPDAERRKSDTTTRNSQSIVTNSSHKPSPVITHQNVYDLIENVRINTELSHEMSKVALVTVIQGLHDILPASAFPYLSTIVSLADESFKADNVQIEQTRDASRLKVIFNELTSCKEDSQQRSWMLHEDEIVIKEYIKELISILSNADLNITRHVISSNYHVINNLILYYQMETRWPIRQLLLQSFGILCNLDKTVVNIMLNSVLPCEIARDIEENPSNISKINFSTTLLTMIFSMGEGMPITHFEFLGNRFIKFILNYIECPPAEDIDEEIPDLFLNFILAYNLQFHTLHENVVVNVLSEKSLAKTFTEKLLLLINREEDPVNIFDHEPQPPHSVLKLLIDLFDSKRTGGLFYTNDIRVLIDIIVRNILDLSPGDKRRQQYLELCKRVMRNTNYGEHQHRRDDILKCFTRIFCEETEQSKIDQKLVREIMNEFPHYFK
ncbi:NCK-interacting protein with SH3 domain [Onthophagus taurus]|uniref:NCK-interacting protein with SH3 domain n=1 Tax=Onthophagus taurus TaxID=166361 RepID=UPI0039BE14D9